MGERVAEVGLGGGGAGMAGLLLKGGAMALTAGVLAGGIVAVHAHPKPGGGHRAPGNAHRRARVEAREMAPMSVSTASLRPVADVRRARETSRAPSTYGLTRMAGRVRARRHRVFRSEDLIPAGSATWPSPHRGGGDRGGAGGVTHEPRSPGASGVRGGRGDGTGDEGGRGGGGQYAPNGDGVSGGEGALPGDGSKGGATDGGREGGGGGEHGDQGEPFAEAGGGAQAQHDSGDTSETASSQALTGTASSGGEQIPVEAQPGY